MKYRIGNSYGLFTLIVSGLGFTIFAFALPRNPEILLGYFVLIPFIMMGIFVVLVEYWEILIDNTKKQKVKQK